MGAAVLALFLLGGLAFATRGSGLPFTEREQVWAVGVYTGDNPLSVSDRGSNPVVTREQFNDSRIRGVADPWLVIDDNRWLLFYEIIVRDTSAPNNEHAVLAVSTSDDGGTHWEYQGVVLEEPWHLSYPQVFSSGGDYYMVPESLHAGEVSLYRATDFPMTWAREAVLVSGDFTDPTIFEHDDRWWLMVTEEGEAPDDTLRLFQAAALGGPYREHPLSPIVSGDISKARSAGPVIRTPEGLMRMAQDLTQGYGHAVRAFLITTLTASDFVEEELSPSPLLTGSGEGWNADGMHHLAPVQRDDGSWVAAVDGFFYQRVFGLDR